MGAVISACGKYRYRLDRFGATGGKTLMFVMVNPSTADAENDDATIRKCRGFAARNGFDHLLVGNLFAFRSTDVAALAGKPDPVGPENDAYLHAMFREADIVIAAWGSLNKLPKNHLRRRWQQVVHLADRIPHQVKMIGRCADGHPKHPLMVGYDAKIEPWPVPWFANRKAV
jgi:hypothetical protein